MHIKQLTHTISGCAVEVHKVLGPGLLEAPDEACLCRELSVKGSSFERQKSLSGHYQDEHIEVGYWIDILVANKE